MALPAKSIRAAEALPFLTSFESTDAPPYAAGDIDGQGSGGSWTVHAGAVAVDATTPSLGAQSVEMGADSFVEVAVNASNNVIWTDVFLQTQGSVSAPLVPTGKASSVVFCNASNGIWALDGNGAGGGSYVSVLDPLRTNQFVRVSIRLDFTANIYDVWIDGAPLATGLGFKDDDVDAINAVELASEGTSYFDDISVTTEGLDTDTDTDGLADLDEMKLYGTSISDPDSDDDQMEDGDEVFAGTSPTDSASLLEAALNLVGGQLEVSVETVGGRLYTIQSVLDPSAGPWQDVLGLVDLPGDGTLQNYAVGGIDGTTTFRVKVSQ